MPAKILYVHRGSVPQPPGFAAHLAPGDTIDTHPIPYEAKAKGVPAVFAIPDLAHYDAIVASEYYLVWALALRLTLTHIRTPLIALGFNQSTRLVRTGQRTVDRLLDRVWRRVARFVVHSQSEATLFSAAHGIPAAKFTFAHWGYDLPAFEPGIFASPYPRFVSMIGRNNRDIDLFLKAVSRADANGLLVTSAYMMTPALKAAMPANVTVLLDVSMDICLDIVRQSAAHLVLVTDDTRGAGHISAVSAMLVEKPQIFSAVAPLDDYLVDGFNGIAVPMHDVDAAAAAITRLLSDDILAQSLGKNGRDLALRWMSNAHTATRAAAVVEAVLGRTTLGADDWPAVRATLDPT